MHVCVKSCVSATSWVSKGQKTIMGLRPWCPSYLKQCFLFTPACITLDSLHISAHSPVSISHLTVVETLCYWTCTLQRVLGTWTQFSYPLCHLLRSKTASWVSLLCQTLWPNPTRYWNIHPGICTHVMTKVNGRKIRFYWSRNFYPLMRRSFRTQEGVSKSRDATRPCFKPFSCSHHSKGTYIFWNSQRQWEITNFFLIVDN